MKKYIIFLALTCAMMLILCGSVSAADDMNTTNLTSNRHIFINVSNDEGVKYNTDGEVHGGPNGTYYIKADGGGMREMHITTNTSNANGQVTGATAINSNSSGKFYLTNTGGRGYSDNMILMISVQGPIPDDFALHITSSGYTWTPIGSKPTEYQYLANAVNQTFTKADFLYGPHIYKPGPGTLGVWSLPLYSGQNTSDPSTAQYLMFVDLYAGILTDSSLIDGGSVKVEFNFTNMNTFAAFNMYGWSYAATQGQGISWTQDSTSSGYYIDYIPPVANFTATPTNGKTPLTVQFTDTSSGNIINAWAWDFDNDGTIDSTEQNPTYTYNNPGIYTVKLTVSGPYDSDNEIKTNFITINPVTNTRTNKTYSSIQAAIDDAETLNGDTILVGSGPYTETYTENVNVTKQLTIATRGKVTVTALDVNNPVFKISLGGTNSIINGFTITGATGSSGIYLDPFVNSTIIGNNITGNLNGIYIQNADSTTITNVTITGNNITNNSNNGIHVGNGNATITENNITGNSNNGIFIGNGSPLANNTIEGNNITNNLNGVYIEDSNDTIVAVRNNITKNNIKDNSNIGVHAGNGSPNIQYNRICNNGVYGLKYTANGENTANATYNWWGTNNPTYVNGITAPEKADIYDVHDSSHVNYNPWIVLTVNTTPTLLKTGAKSNVTVDLTHDNNGNEVTGDQIPDGAPVVFAYSLGTVTHVNTTLSNNTANATVTGGSESGTADVTATVDGYTTGVPITMDTVSPVVSADVSGGTYNSTQTVTLTTDDPTSTIYYTINGYNPTTSSTPYTGPIIIDSTASLKFAAIDPAGNWSPVNIQNYLIGTTPIADSDWPKFQNDINNTGLSGYIGPQTNSTAWIFTTSSNIRYSAPVIGTDGTIYIGNYGKIFYAINPDGTQKWSYTAGSAIWGSAIIGGDGTIYFCGEYATYALNPNGTLKWTYNAGQRGSPTIGSDGTLYIGSGSRLTAINPDGTLKWNYETGGYTYYSSPAIGADGTIYIGSRDRNLYAINPDGTLKWSYRTGGEIDGSPAIGSDGTIYIGSKDRTFYAINPDGTLKWDYITSDQNLNAHAIYGSAAIGADGTIYIGNGAGNLFAFNPDGTLKWRYTTGGSIQGSPVIDADGTIYIGSDKFYALNPDGTLKWNYTTGNGIQGAPAIGANGTLYIGSYDKKLYAFKDPDADLNTSVTVNDSTLNINDNLNIDFNVSNNGLGTAFRTVLTYTLPEWLKYIDASADMGIVSYNASNRMITWNIGDFAVVDSATMSLLTQVIKSGTYTIIPGLTTITSDPNLTAHTGSADVTITGNVVNSRTGTIYDTIQEAINDALNGDTINVGVGNYTENVIINKQLILNALGLATVTPLDVNSPVFSILIAGNNSVINGFTITGAVNSYGIYMASFVNSTIANNTIIENGLDGIFIEGSASTTNMSLNTITGNKIKNNTRDGIRIYAGSPTINSNEISGNGRDGIRIQFGNPTINSNNIYNNTKDGIRIQSGNPVVHFNRIYNNGLYGLHDASTTPNKTNATLNWWGTNNPTYIRSTTAPGKTDIYDARSTGSHVIYNPWIVLTADAIPDLLKAGANSTITAYLTHDSNGNEITGQVPDSIPVSFDFNLGTINPENTTTNGSATSTLTAGNTSGTTNATVTVDACTINVPVTVDTVAPTVTNNVPGGTYNTTQNVTLTTDEASTIYYTTNGTNPTTSSTVYNGPIAINTTTTLRYAALDPAGNWSLIYLINYVIGTGGLADSPQPGFQNNNNHTGQSNYSGPQTNTTFWNYNTGSAIYGYGSPTIGADGTIYIGKDTGVLYAINPDGTLKWNYTAGGLLRSSPTIGADGTIYFISGSIIYALNYNGTQKWNYTMGGSTYASPAISADGTIYIGSGDKNLYAINPDGTLKWTYLTEPGVSYNGLHYSSPAIGADGTIYIGSQNGRFYAFNPDGTLKWKYKATLSYIRSSPSIGADGTIYFTADDLYAMNPDGTLKWKNNATSGSSWSTPAIGTDGTIYVSRGTGYLNAFNPDGTLKWTYNTGKTMYYTSAAIGADGIIYFGSYNMYAMNPDGTLKWQYDNANTYSAAIGSDGTLYFGSSNGNLYAIKDVMPVANFTANITNGTAPLTVQFNATSSYIVSYAWDFNNDGVIDSTEQNPTYTYSNAGNYTVKLTVTNAAGSVSEVKTNYITVDNTAPVPSAELASGLYNTDKTVNLSAVDDLDSNPKIYYTLDGSDPTTSSTLYTEPVNINGEGTTTLKFIAVDATGNISNVIERTYTIDKTKPTVTANPRGGTFNTAKTVTLATTDTNTTTTYYTTDNSDPQKSNTRRKYTTSIQINSTTTLKFAAVDLAGNWSPTYTEKYTIDTTKPTASVNIKGGLYNTNKTIYLKMSEAGTIYYTRNGSTPTTASTKYTGPISITSTTTLKFMAVDKAGNKSPVYTQKYTIDKTAPKMISTNPKNGATGFSRTATIAIRFSENIKSSTAFSKIVMKNLNTGRVVSIKKWIKGNILYIKMISKRYAYYRYSIYIPKAAVKDNAGNNLATGYTLKFKTGRY